MKIFYGYNEKEISLDEVLLHIPNGWHQIVTKLIQDLEAMGWDGKLIQIKEKFGGLRFYAKYETYSLQKRISETEEESYATCQKCGKPGKARNFSGWISTVCEEHSVLN
jgi:hypothetical protein